jgi:hypothetical protein
LERFKISSNAALSKNQTMSFPVCMSPEVIITLLQTHTWAEGHGPHLSVCLYPAFIMRTVSSTKNWEFQGLSNILSMSLVHINYSFSKFR